VGSDQELVLSECEHLQDLASNKGASNSFKVKRFGVPSYSISRWYLWRLPHNYTFLN